MSVRTLRSPAPREALTALEAAVDAGALVTVHGRCRVDYDGRASSELGPGDRLVVLKPDGAALVHTEEGRTPVNWQPPGSAHAASVRDDRLRVRSTRESPAERLDVADWEFVTDVVDTVGWDPERRRHPFTRHPRLRDGCLRVVLRRDDPFIQPELFRTLHLCGVQVHPNDPTAVGLEKLNGEEPDKAEPDDGNLFAESGLRQTHTLKRNAADRRIRRLVK